MSTKLWDFGRKAICSNVDFPDHGCFGSRSISGHVNHTWDLVVHFSCLLIAHVLKFLHCAFWQGYCFWEIIIIGLEDFIAHVGLVGIRLHEVLHHFGHLGIATFSTCMSFRKLAIVSTWSWSSSSLMRSNWTSISFEPCLTPSASFKSIAPPFPRRISCQSPHSKLILLPPKSTTAFSISRIGRPCSIGVAPKITKHWMRPTLSPSFAGNCTIQRLTLSPSPPNLKLLSQRLKCKCSTSMPINSSHVRYLSTYSEPAKNVEAPPSCMQSSSSTVTQLLLSEITCWAIPTKFALESAGRFLLGEVLELLVGQLAGMWPNIPHRKHIIMCSPLSLILDIPFLGEPNPFEPFDPFLPFDLPFWLPFWTSPWRRLTSRGWGGSSKWELLTTSDCNHRGNPRETRSWFNWRLLSAYAA